MSTATYRCLACNSPFECGCTPDDVETARAEAEYDRYMEDRMNDHESYLDSLVGGNY